MKKQRKKCYITENYSQERKKKNGESSHGLKTLWRKLAKKFKKKKKMGKDLHINQKR